MRLLRMNQDESLCFADFPEHNVPSFAILSHTWRIGHEATIQDVVNSTPDSYSSFDKLYFCGKQAKLDRLQYFWVDTCCIDKSSSAELSEAINSMFDWYRRSSKCYVLLTDVSFQPEAGNLESRDTQLRKSRWFTRGWTLQELLAPATVEFFSREGNLLGSKRSLEKLLSGITGIPVAALRGTHLAFFSIEDKMSWVANRQTTREEDIVYSLLGLFDVHIPAIYGEGEEHARRRLQSEIEMHARNATRETRVSVQDADSQWIVPFERNPQFTGRDSELDQLQRILLAHDQYTKVAVSGLGGVGKTQLVLELLYRLREKDKQCSAIWIQATTMESLDQGYHEATRRFGLRDSQAKDANVKEILRDFLSQETAGPWVLVFDNADDVDMWAADNTASDQTSSKRLLEYIPRSKMGRVIFTTRDRKVGVKLAHQNTIEVPNMGESTAVQMLRNSLIRKELVDAAQTETKTMLAWLTHLPLAIAQAAAYINETGITISDYLSLVGCQEETIIELLTEEFEDDARYSDSKNPVATTWLISFQMIQQRNPLAADYMFFMACIDHKDIPKLLLPPGASPKKELDAIGALSAFSFITIRPEDAALDLHRLVHLTVRNWLRKEGKLTEWMHAAVTRLEEVFPNHEHGNRVMWRAYLPHARRLLESDLIARDYTFRVALEWKVALCYYNDGRFHEAEALFREVSKCWTVLLGEEHPDTLKSMARLALTYHGLSRFQEAKLLGLKALEAQRRVLGEEDPETLSTMSHLAMTFSDLSQWKESEELELLTLEIRQRVLGSHHPDTLVGMSNLVYLYNCQGWWKQAEDLGKQTVTARKKVLGVEHPDTLLSIGNLAHTYNNQGRYKDAEELLVQVVQVRERILGKDHPHTLSGMSNLAVSYHNQGQWDMAEALQAQVVATRNVVLGPEHFSTLTSMAHLASTYHSQGRLDEAKRLSIKVLELRKKILGTEHHHTLNSMTSLASICVDGGQLAEAEELALQVLAVRIRVLGMHHHHSLKSMDHLAAIYEKQGRLKESADLKEQVAEATTETAA